MTPYSYRWSRPSASWFTKNKNFCICLKLIYIQCRYSLDLLWRRGRPNARTRCPVFVLSLHVTLILLAIADQWPNLRHNKRNPRLGYILLHSRPLYLSWPLLRKIVFCPTTNLLIERTIPLKRCLISCWTIGLKYWKRSHWNIGKPGIGIKDRRIGNRNIWELLIRILSA